MNTQASAHPKDATYLHFIVPVIAWSDGLELTLKSVLNVPEEMRGTFVLIAPPDRLGDIRSRVERIECSLSIRIAYVKESGKGVYPAFNDGLRHLAGQTGYVVFLGAGDVLHEPAQPVVDAMRNGSSLICIPVGGDPAILRRVFGRRGWISCLPNPQGCIYNLSLGPLLNYEERLRIYDDVVQRIAIIHRHGCVELDVNPLITIDGHGVSGAQTLKKVGEHFDERLSLFLPVFAFNEPILALKYVIGSVAMLWRYARGSKFSTVGNSV